MVTAVESGTKMPNKTIGGGPSLTCTNEISTQIAHKCLDDTNTDSEETEPDLADRLAHVSYSYCTRILHGTDAIGRK
ncbi:hypothetical protein BU24DRAFT_417369 [Aaosphaeria arxii CBS 175.79]|uniref:Uncharacterized protein n=1 Tax=Aaosphaeria arxii CBS 175.79 TaxID=1450172 RepID=A0A6A5Y833_9PLEO|nr:uncharacterized protein BU24DRAFT_417369 [Aaosphaeria arxii CBS 175.79]KAF2021745.1 hypothetical protein BU24DRAFT_417369 [Aaosphaeria arxii CBS 175.79]